MKKPGPIRKDSLRHPKDNRSSFNGDKWKNEKRDNYTSRVSTTEGTRKPSNVKQVEIAHLTEDGQVVGHKDFTGAIQSIPKEHVFRPCFVRDSSTTSPSPSFNQDGLKKHQERMVNKKKGQR